MKKTSAIFMKELKLKYHKIIHDSENQYLICQNPKH